MTFPEDLAIPGFPVQKNIQVDFQDIQDFQEC